jgi:hypothetical protein
VVAQEGREERVIRRGGEERNARNEDGQKEE